MTKITIDLSDEQIAGLRHWHTESADFGDVEHHTGADLIVVLNDLAERAATDDTAERPTDEAVVALFGNRRFTAQFTPQAWVHDYAVDVDAEGDQTWDCTREMAAMPDDYRTDLLAAIEAEGEALDNDDWLKDDPDAPDWVRNYHGPFSIQIRRKADG